MCETDDVDLMEIYERCRFLEGRTKVGRLLICSLHIVV